MMLQKGAGAIIGYSDLLLYSTIILFSKKFLKNSPRKIFPEKSCYKMSNEIKTITHPISVLDDAKDYLEGNIDEYLLKQMANPEVDKLPDRETIYIVAGDHVEFEQYVAKKKEEYRRRKPEMREESKPMPYYHYVKNKYDLMGLTNVKGYYIGTASKRADIRQIKQAIEYVKERAELLGKDTTYTFAKLFK